MLDHSVDVSLSY